MSYYKHHLFICTNQRDDGKGCCQDFDSESARKYMKQRAKELDIHGYGPGQCRINNAGCLNRCKQGPVMVIYPEAIWYTWVDKSDLDEIVDKHLLKGEIVERLQIPDTDAFENGKN